MLVAIQTLAMVAGVAYGIPQIVRVFRAHTAVGVSCFAWQLLLATTASWVFHGVIVASPAIAVSNGVGVATSILLLWLMIPERHLPVLRTCILPALLLALLVALRLLCGPVVYASAVVVPQVVSMSGQLFELIRSERLTGVSPFFLWFGVALQAIWLIYGVAVHDVAIAISAVATGVVAIANVTWYLLRAFRVVPAHPGFLRRTVADEMDPSEPVADAAANATNPVV